MFVKKTLVAGISAAGLIASSGLAVAQGPVGLGNLPGAGGMLSMASAGDQPSLDTEPLAGVALPARTADVSFTVSEFLSGAIVAETSAASLPGLAQQSADFLQNQDGSSGGADPAAPQMSAVPLAGDAPAGGNGSGGDAAPAPGDVVDAAMASEAPTQEDVENRGSAVQTQVTGLGDMSGSPMSMTPTASDSSAAPDASALPEPSALPESSALTEPSALPESSALTEPSALPEPSALTQPPSGGPAPALPEQPEGGAGGDSGASDTGGAQASVSVPADIEEQSPLPQPFQLSSVANVTVSAEAENPAPSGGAPAPSGGGEAPSAPAVPAMPDAPSAPESGGAPSAPVSPEALPEA